MCVQLAPPHPQAFISLPAVETINASVHTGKVSMANVRVSRNTNMYFTPPLPPPAFPFSVYILVYSMPLFRSTPLSNACVSHPLSLQPLTFYRHLSSSLRKGHNSSYHALVPFSWLFLMELFDGKAYSASALALTAILGQFIATADPPSSCHPSVCALPHTGTAPRITPVQQPLCQRLRQFSHQHGSGGNGCQLRWRLKIATPSCTIHYPLLHQLTTAKSSLSTVGHHSCASLNRPLKNSNGSWCMSSIWQCHSQSRRPRSG